VVKLLSGSGIVAWHGSTNVFPLPLGPERQKGGLVSVLVMTPFALHPFNELAACRRFCRFLASLLHSNRILRIKRPEFSPKTGFSRPLVPQNRNMSGDGCEPRQKRTLGDQEEQDGILEPARQALKRAGIEEGSPEERLERQESEALWAQIDQHFEKGDARNRAKEFVNTLMHGTDLPVGGSVDMTYLPDLPDLEAGGQTRPMIVRKIIDELWDACIKLVDTPGMRYRVAVVGTPGIGKTLSTAILIRKLLRQGKTVVYLCHSADKSQWYYEFVPRNGAIVAKVYREKGGSHTVPSLYFSSTY
jgi:hypothetical protein